jgi:hypothetical protein
MTQNNKKIHGTNPRIISEETQKNNSKLKDSKNSNENNKKRLGGEKSLKNKDY